MWSTKPACKRHFPGEMTMCVSRQLRAQSYPYSVYVCVRWGGLDMNVSWSLKLLLTANSADRGSDYWSDPVLLPCAASLWEPQFIQLSHRLLFLCGFETTCACMGLCLQQFPMQEINSKSFRDNACLFHGCIVRDKIAAACLYFMKHYCLSSVVFDLYLV